MFLGDESIQSETQPRNGWCGGRVRVLLGSGPDGSQRVTTAYHAVRKPVLEIFENRNSGHRAQYMDVTSNAKSFALGRV